MTRYLSIVARISYIDPAAITDPELAADMEHSRRYGTPRPETQAIRFHVPAVAKAFMRPWKSIFREGVVDHSLKALWRVYVSKTLDCACGASQRSLRGGEQGLPGADYCALPASERSSRFDERQKAALLYTSMLIWNPEGVDDALWARLREHFGEEEI